MADVRKRVCDVSKGASVMSFFYIVCVSLPPPPLPPPPPPPPFPGSVLIGDKDDGSGGKGSGEPRL